MARKTIATAVLVFFVGVNTAHGQISSRDADQAEKLFQTARTLMSEGRFAEACPKLHEAFALDPGGGIELALALCHEGEGKWATALHEFKRAMASAANSNRPDRVSLSQSHITTLEREVSRLTLVVANAPQLTVTVDGSAVAPSDWSTRIPVDPGAHVVRATAPDYEPWETTISAQTSGQSLEVRVPALVAKQNPTRVESSITGEKIAGFAIGGLGLVGIGIGSYFGVSALNKQADTRNNGDCQGTRCSQTGVDLISKAKQESVVADIAFASGIVLLGTAVGLLVHSMKKTVAAATRPFELTAGARGGTVSWKVTW